MGNKLSPRQTPGATVSQTTNGWRLDIPAGARRTYRLAQIDDYARTPRRLFSHVPPLTLSLRARLSAADLPGTWGFGLWNDPFGLSLGFGGNPARLPALPQAAWFFHASSPNWLSLRDELPANGFFAWTFRSPLIPSLLLAPGLLVAPLLALRPVSRLLRRLASRVIRQDGEAVSVDVTQWHEYSIQWLSTGCSFTVDGNEILYTQIFPRPPLGLVLWIDNQFAAWTPEGRLGYGTLENPAAWLEIEGLKIQSG
ncbi:MAG: hypothetical protein ABIF04_04450 [Chloroflexota bacterium]